MSPSEELGHGPLADLVADWDGDEQPSQIEDIPPPMRGGLLAALPIQRSIVPPQGTPISSCPTNIDLSTMRGKALAIKAGSPGEYELTDGSPLKMVVTHWLILPDTQQDEKTGEVSEFVRVVLYDAAGKHYRTSSAHAPFRLRAMLELFTQEQWAAGVPIVIVQRASKRYRGSHYHDIMVDVEEMSGS